MNFAGPRHPYNGVQYNTVQLEQRTFDAGVHAEFPAGGFSTETIVGLRRVRIAVFQWRTRERTSVRQIRMAAPTQTGFSLERLLDVRA